MREKISIWGILSLQNIDETDSKKTLYPLFNNPNFVYDLNGMCQAIHSSTKLMLFYKRMAPLILGMFAWYPLYFIGREAVHIWSKGYFKAHAFFASIKFIFSAEIYDYIALVLCFLPIALFYLRERFLRSRFRPLKVFHRWIAIIFFILIIASLTFWMTFTIFLASFRTSLMQSSQLYTIENGQILLQWTPEFLSYPAIITSIISAILVFVIFYKSGWKETYVMMSILTILCSFISLILTVAMPALYFQRIKEIPGHDVSSFIIMLSVYLVLIIYWSLYPILLINFNEFNEPLPPHQKEEERIGRR